ncbi:MAG: efflux RND transporter periplasmic adaptor subunit [Clostridium sp.]
MINKGNIRNNKGFIITIISILGVTVLIIFLLLGMGKESDFTFEDVKVGNITTNYTFSGIVESKNKQEVFSQNPMQVEELMVSEGDMVQKNEVIFKTNQGEKIKSNIDGKISKIYIEEDSLVMGGTKIIDISDYDNLQVSIKVDEYEITCVSVNKNVAVNIAAIDKNYSGKISKVSDEAINKNGVSYFTAIIDMPKDSGVKVGMNAEALIQSKSAKNVVIISMKSLQFDDNNNPYVLLKGKNDIPTNKYVKVGINDGNIVEIKDGLTKGQVVIIPKNISTKEGSFTQRGKIQHPGMKETN